MYLASHKGNLFLTNLSLRGENIEMSRFRRGGEKLISDITQGLELDRNLAKKVWVYFVEANGAVTKTIYNSIGTIAKALDVHHTSINNHLDKWITGGLKGNYLFSAELNNLDLNKLMDTHSLRKFNNLNVWVYDALTLELIDSFSSMQKAADYFNVDYRSLLKHLGGTPQN